MSEAGYSTFDLRVRAAVAVERRMPQTPVAEAYGVDRTTLYRWVKRYEHNGKYGLERKPGSCRPRQLEELELWELWDVILSPASEFGYETDLWTVGRLQRVIQEQYDVVVSNDTIWRR